MSREVAKRVGRLTEQLAALSKRQVLAVALSLPACPEWAVRSCPLGERCACKVVPNSVTDPSQKE